MTTEPESHTHTTSEQEHDLLFMLSVDLLCIASFDGYFLDLNPAWEWALGFTLDELKARPYIEFVHPDDRASTLAEAASLQTGETTVSFENRYRCIDGSYKWLLWSSRSQPKQGRIYGVARDVTERKQAEAALQRRRELLETVIRLGKSVAVETHWTDCLTKIYWAVRTDLGFDRMAIFLYEPEANVLRGVIGTDRAGGLETIHDIVAESPPVDAPNIESLWQVLRDPAGFLFMPNFAKIYNIPADNEMFGVTEHALAACWAGDKPVGVLAVDNFVTGRPMSPEQLDALRLFAGYAGLAIENTRSRQSILHYSARMQTLHEIDQAILMAKSAQEIAFAALSRIRELVPCPRASVTVFDFEAHAAVMLAVHTHGTTRLSEGERVTLDFFDLDLLRRGEPEAIEDVASLDLQAEGIHSRLSLPLICQGELIGTLNLSGSERGRFLPEQVKVAGEVADQLAIALMQADLFARVRQHADEASALLASAEAITASLELDTALRVIADQASLLLHADGCRIHLLESDGLTLRCLFANDPLADEVRAYPLQIGDGITGNVALTGVAEIVNHIETDPRFVRFAAAPHPTGCLALAPLKVRQRLIGVMTVVRMDATQSFVPNDLRLLIALAEEAAIAVENARLFDSLQRANEELTQAYDATIKGWSRALDLRDKETVGHTERVAELAVRLARAMGLPEEEIVHIRRGALLHDIGKMGIADSVLLKPGQLTSQEWEAMRRHPQYAFDMLAPIDFLRPALDIPYCHHEHWNGGGYPRGLKGEAIPLSARIFAVADVWDALCSDRPYHSRWPEAKARDYIREQAGLQFDPQVTRAFLELLEA